MPKTLSASVKVAGRYAIGMDYSTYLDSASERTHLAHEVGHCMTDSFYYPYEAIDTRGKNEHKANTWATHHLIPWKELKKALTDGITERWELAEYFNVTERFIEKAFFIYQCEGRL